MAAALLAIGLANTAGVYLSVLNIPTFVVVHRTADAIAWAAPAGTLSWFILSETVVASGTVSRRTAPILTSL